MGKSSDVDDNSLGEGSDVWISGLWIFEVWELQNVALLDVVGLFGWAVDDLWKT